jgi:hypothetical protein
MSWLYRELQEYPIRARFGRDPTDTEMYMMHQQGLGFYTRGAMTNIGGNPYPGMRGPQTHESFEAGWGRSLARGRAGFEARHPDVSDRQTREHQSSIRSPYQVATNVQDPHYTSDDINELIEERAGRGMSGDTSKPGLLELDRIYDSPQQERFNRPYAYRPQRDPSKTVPTGAEKKEPLPSHFYPPTGR